MRAVSALLALAATSDAFAPANKAPKTAAIAPANKNSEGPSTTKLNYGYGYDVPPALAARESIKDGYTARYMMNNAPLDGDSPYYSNYGGRTNSYYGRTNGYGYGGYGGYSNGYGGYGGYGMNRMVGYGGGYGGYGGGYGGY